LPRNKKRKKTYEELDEVIVVDITGDNSDRGSISSDRSITETRESSCVIIMVVTIFLLKYRLLRYQARSMDPISDPSKFKKNHLAAVTSMIPIHSIPPTRQNQTFFTERLMF